MKFFHPQIKTVFDTDADKIWSLEIENKVFFRECISDLNKQLNGEKGQFSLYFEEEEQDISSTCELIFNPLGINLNQKKLLASVEKVLENRIREILPSNKLSRNLRDLKNILINLAFDMDLDITAFESDPSDLVKIAGIKLKEEYNNPIEKILTYMSLVRSFEKNKLFIFINLDSYFTFDELSSLFEGILQKDLPILLINSSSFPSLPEVERVTIDESLCEICSSTSLGAM